MRRIAFALVLMVVFGWVTPSQAQWWGGGWGRPCFGGCRPWRDRGGWAEPRRFAVFGDGPGPIWGRSDAVEASRFRDGGGDWRRMLWHHEMRWRSLEAWRRWAAAGRDAAPPEAGRPGVRRWPMRRRPPPSLAVAMRPEPHRVEAADPIRDGGRGLRGAEAAVSMFPTGALRLAQPRIHAALPSHAPVAAEILRHPAVARGLGPPARPVGTPLRPAAARPSPSADGEPPGLHSQPTPTPTGRPVSAPAAPAPEAPEPVRAVPADVPVAPLD